MDVARSRKSSFDQWEGVFVSVGDESKGLDLSEGEVFFDSGGGWGGLGSRETVRDRLKMRTKQYTRLTLE